MRPDDAAGSWKFSWSDDDFIDRAVFRLVPVERSATEQSATGPEQHQQREGALIQALLSHPAAERLTGLELHLTDYHHSAEQAAIALSQRQWPRLETLYFGYDFGTLLEPHETSTGERIDPEEYLDTALVNADTARAMWNSLPALRTLELEGAFLFDDLTHDTLTRLRTRGAVFSDGSLFSFSTPSLVSLAIGIGHDIHGTVGSNAQLNGLEADRFPRLRSLDLSEAYFAPDEGSDFVALGAHPLLPQLRYLGLRELVIEDHEDDEQEPLDVLREMAPRFAHLELEVAGDIEVEGADEDEVEEVLAEFGLSQ